MQIICLTSLKAFQVKVKRSAEMLSDERASYVEKKWRSHIRNFPSPTKHQQKSNLLLRAWFLQGWMGKNLKRRVALTPSVSPMARGLELHWPCDVFVIKVSSKCHLTVWEKHQMVSAANLTLRCFLIHVNDFFRKQCFKLQSCACSLTEMFMYLWLATCVVWKAFPNLYLNIHG